MSTRPWSQADRSLVETPYHSDCYCRTCCLRYSVAPACHSYHLSGSSHGGIARENPLNTSTVRDSSFWLRYIPCRHYSWKGKGTDINTRKEYHRKNSLEQSSLTRQFSGEVINTCSSKSHRISSSSAGLHLMEMEGLQSAAVV